MSRKARGGRDGTDRLRNRDSDQGGSATKDTAKHKNADPFADVSWDDDHGDTDSRCVLNSSFKQERITDHYIYQNRVRDPLYVVCRTASKEFPVQQPDGTWGWAKGQERVLYRLPEIIEAIRAGASIHVVEGEKDVHAIEEAGGVATCFPGGGKGSSKNLDALDILGKYGGATEVVVWQDKDDTGRKRAANTLARLVGKVEQVRLVEAKEGNDAADHLDAGYSLDEAVPVEVPDLGPDTGHSGHERLGVVLEILGDVSGYDDQFYARCPVHDDRKPSMSVRLGFDGFPVFECHADGCAEDWPAFRAAMLDLGVPDWALRESGPSADPDDLAREIAAALGQMEEADQALDHVAHALNEGQLHELSPPEWLVDGWLPRVGVAVVYGQPGIGKTLELISIAKSVRRGSRWHSRRTRQGSIVFYEGEGLAEFGPRIRAYEAKHSHDGDEAPSWYLTEQVDLTSARSLAAVVRTVRTLVEDSPYPPRLLVIEPLIENMTGDENAEGMDLASRGLRVLAKLLDLCVLVGHHTNASGERARGNDKLRARVHSMFRMERLGTADNAVALIAEKQRNGPLMALELLMVEAEESVVFQAAQELSAEEFNRQREDRREQSKESRKAEVTEAKRQRTRELLLEAIAARPGESQNAIVAACLGKGIGKGGLEAELQALRADPEAVRVEEVAGSYRHYPVENTKGGSERE